MQIREDGSVWPMIVCDWCKTPITDAKDGRVLWREIGRNPLNARCYPVYHTHKRCEDAFVENNKPSITEGVIHDPEFMPEFFPDGCVWPAWLWMSHGLDDDLERLLSTIKFDPGANVEKQ